MAQRLGHAPVGIDIGEEEFTAALEQAPHPVQNGQLVGGEIHHAVGDHQIEAAGPQRQLLELLDAALQKLHVGEAKLLGVVLLVTPGHRQLLRRHVHPHHLTAGAHQLGQQVDIAAAAAAQIQHPQTLQQWRHHQPTAVVARQHLGVDAGQQRAQGLGNAAGVTAGVGAQIGAAAEGGAVVLLHAAAQVGGRRHGGGRKDSGAGRWCSAPATGVRSMSGSWPWHLWPELGMLNTRPRGTAAHAQHFFTVG